MVIGIIITTVAVFGGLYLALRSLEKEKEDTLKKCDAEVYATVEKFVTRRVEMGGDSPDKIGEYPLYKFVFNNQEYRVMGHPCLARIKVGDVVKLYINSNDPTIFYAENEKGFASKWLLVLLVLIPVIVGSFILLVKLIS